MVSYVVTGASRGIGLALVQVLHARLTLDPSHPSQERDPQVHIFAIVRSPGSCDELKKLAGPYFHIVRGDLDMPETLQSAAAEVSKITGGSLDVFINNAALIPSGKGSSTLTSYIGEDDRLLKDFNTFYRTNVVGAVAVTNAFLPLIEKGTQKKVINISSAAGDSEFVEKTGYVTSAAYGISKAALNFINTKYATEFRGRGYTFLAISPGFVDTSAVVNTAVHGPERETLINMFKLSNPDWNGVPLLPKESAELVLGVIDRATPKDSGGFVSQYGNKSWL